MKRQARFAGRMSNPSAPVSGAMLTASGNSLLRLDAQVRFESTFVVRRATVNENHLAGLPDAKVALA